MGYLFTVAARGIISSCGKELTWYSQVWWQGGSPTSLLWYDSPGTWPRIWRPR